MWESQIDTAVKQSVFFIPIITPRVINSKNCGVEFKRFLDREKELGRDDLMFPILYIDVDELQNETQWRGHSLLEVIGQRQYVDWREYRFELDSPALRRAVANLCTQIATALRRPPPNEKTEADDKRRAEQEQAFARARDADTVAAISGFIETYPNGHLAGEAQKEKAKLLVPRQWQATIRSCLNRFSIRTRMDAMLMRYADVCGSFS